ncbi:MAG: hypothetical protein RL711_978 [Bacteroidota bacterium]
MIVMKHLKNGIKYILSLSVGIGLLWWVYHKQDLSTLLIELKNADFFWVGLCFVAALISHISRAYRWNLLLQPLGHQPSLFRNFYAVMMGYLANLVVTRAGEVSRCAILYKSDQVPIETAIGTVVTERIIDLLCLIVIVFITIIIEFDKLGGFIMGLFAKQSPQTPTHDYSYWVLGGLISMAMIGFLLREKIRQNAFIQNILSFRIGLMKGIASIKDVENKWSFVFHTVLIWTMYFCTVYFLFFAFKTTAHLGVNVALALFVVGSLGMVAPVPGGVGAFHFMVTQGLMLYGLPENMAASFAGLAHAIQVLQIVLIGGSAYFSGVYFMNKKAKS